jgi:hypothetical protein
MGTTTCIGTKQNGNECSNKDSKGNGNSLDVIVIAPRTGGVDNNDAKDRSYNDGLMTKTKQVDHH